MSLLFAITLSCAFVASEIAAEGHEMVSYAGFQVWKIKLNSQEDRQFILDIKDSYALELWNERKMHKDLLDVLVSPPSQTKLKLKLAERKITFIVVINDLQAAIDKQKTNINSNTSNSKAVYNMNWISYHRLSDIYAFLTYLNTTYPKLVQLTKIGTSYEKRPLYVLRISSSSAPGTRPAIWIDGGFHAREWISPAVATYIIQQLVEGPANAKLLSNVDWYIMPVVNPDGYEYTHTTDRMWRKTRSVSSTSSCRGVDPNRNFDFQWGGMSTSSDPCSDIYKGIKAFSESETLAMSNFVIGKSNQIKLYLTFHSFGQTILVPYGYDVVYPPDYNDLLALANNAASKFVKYQYDVGNSAEMLYPVAGSSDDWAKSIGIKYSYTIELPDTGIDGFTLPASEILPVCQDLFPALDVFATKVATCCSAVNSTTTAKPVVTSTARPTTTTKPQPTTATSKRTTTKCSCTCG
ncbi:carboxypeptidase B-like [Daphnia carinata]|uniref:carboxypeptidase B-like n=1 Tax=Daphnia carinata TaxID=120202 RepID=UPI00257D8195|nr:carboxypeptidase B-like [Daphnia carinata]